MQISRRTTINLAMTSEEAAELHKATEDPNIQMPGKMFDFFEHLAQVTNDHVGIVNFTLPE